MKQPIYLDHAATTPVHPDACEAMIQYMTEVFGNPSSVHHFGRETRKALDEGRTAIARAIGASPDEIVFTGGGTEADNLAVIGYVQKHRKPGGAHVISCATEHHGVLHALEELERDGVDVTYLPVDEKGNVSAAAVQDELRDDTVLVSIMTANNETGTIQPIRAISEVLADHAAVFHTDAVQAVGKMPVNVESLGVDMLASSAHKFNGPNGIGFLYVRRGITLKPLLHGGSQESRRRAGTENTAGIVGMKTALERSLSELSDREETYRLCRRTLLEALDESGVDYLQNGDPENGLLQVMNLSFPGADVEQLLMNLDLEGIAVSSGSACTAGSVEPSHVLTAMHGDTDRSRAAIRFSFGLGTTGDDVQKAATAVDKSLARMKVK
ncbi:cysteine desulfurase family protein [Alkalicoccus urumqiensis]|uniref:cysteine desulfurase family protein n=1 Tax=Alkalicoccus urumqiensis TaxID=1548213 RepID=UPI00247818B2|nr:cysteine desulfurase family protein [Alkalicoccus urumqiensis]